MPRALRVIVLLAKHQDRAYRVHVAFLEAIDVEFLGEVARLVESRQRLRQLRILAQAARLQPLARLAQVDP